MDKARPRRFEPHKAQVLGRLRRGGDRLVQGTLRGGHHLATVPMSNAVPFDGTEGSSGRRYQLRVYRPHRLMYWFGSKALPAQHRPNGFPRCAAVFNLGVEIGQLAFVAAVLTAGGLFRPASIGLPCAPSGSIADSSGSMAVSSR